MGSRWIWTRGRCETCQRIRSLRRGKCIPCHQPEDRRDIVDHGVPCGSADAMALIVKHCREKKMDSAQTKSVLEAVHPILMENVSVSSNGKLSVRDKNLIWIRRQCWMEGKPSDLYTN